MNLEKALKLTVSFSDQGKDLQKLNKMIIALRISHPTLFQAYKQIITSYIFAAAHTLQKVTSEETISQSKLQRIVTALVLVGLTDHIDQAIAKKDFKYVMTLPPDKIHSMSEWLQYHDLAKFSKEPPSLPSLTLLTQHGQQIVKRNEEKEETSKIGVGVEVKEIPVSESVLQTITKSQRPVDKDACLQMQAGLYADNTPFVKGTYGSIHDICTDATFSNCPYVAKVIKFRYPCEPSIFFVEQAIAKRASDLGYGPEVMDSFYCKQKSRGTIIYRKYAGNITELKMTSRRLKNLLKKVQLMHDDGIFHQDLFTKNILYRKTSHGNTEFRITDFGISIPFERAVPSVLKACDLVTLLYGWFFDERWSLVPAYTNTDLSINEVFQYATKYVSLDDLTTAISIRINDNGGTPESPHGNKFVETHPLEMYNMIIANLPQPFINTVGACIDHYFVWQNVSTVLDEEKDEVDLLPQKLIKKYNLI